MLLCNRNIGDWMEFLILQNANIVNVSQIYTSCFKESMSRQL